MTSVGRLSQPRRGVEPELIHFSPAGSLFIRPRPRSDSLRLSDFPAVLYLHVSGRNLCPDNCSPRELAGTSNDALRALSGRDPSALRLELRRFVIEHRAPIHCCQCQCDRSHPAAN
ncbi:unnamed protein product [Heligmosomoides polygyrus]|uniref:DUF2218 domain-containing protein n=1 Tax=Heligmosomoides polygyrus TaxID=6339 RepID=A0A183FQX9_HELPZ|nr:unnamed protein product [Heligmosomoides polygyrus]